MGFVRILRGALAITVGAATACGPAMPRHLDRTFADPFATARLPAADSAAPTGKLSLAEAYKLALVQSEATTIAERGVWEAEIHARETLNTITPTMSLTGSAIYQRERIVGTTTLVPAQQLIGAFQLLQPLVRPGFFASREADEHAVQSAGATSKRAHQQLARDVTEAFINVLRSRKLLDLAHAAVARAKTQYDLAVGRVKAGQALRNVELLAQIDLRRAELQEATAQRDTGITSVAFQRLVGRAPPTELELPPTPAMPAADQALDLARNRSDLKALDLQVSRAKAAETATANRRWWPRLDLDAIVQANYPQVLGRNLDWQVLGLLTIPLLQNGHEFTDLALRKNETGVAGLELEAQRKVVVEELDRAVLRAASAEHSAEIANQQVEAAREYYKLVDKQVRLGAITFLEVTNAQAVLVEGENAYEVAKMDRLLAIYDYLFAIGALDLSSPTGVAPAPTPR